MYNDTIRMRTAVQMFIDFLLEHREELEKGITEKHRQEAREALARIRKEQEKSRTELDDDAATN
ncbi:MAG: hypothetical protein AAF702_11895 [Chloroflexota bacterium]